MGRWTVESPRLVTRSKVRYYVKCPLEGGRGSKLGKIWSTLLLNNPLVELGILSIPNESDS